MQGPNGFREGFCRRERKKVEKETIGRGEKNSQTSNLQEKKSLSVRHNLTSNNEVYLLPFSASLRNSFLRSQNLYPEICIGRRNHYPFSVFFTAGRAFSFISMINYIVMDWSGWMHNETVGAFFLLRISTTENFGGSEWHHGVMLWHLNLPSSRRRTNCFSLFRSTRQTLEDREFN